MMFSNAFSCVKMTKFQFKFHWNVFPRVQLTITQHWFRYLLGAEWAICHYLNQCWSDSLTHICGTRGRWVDISHFLNSSPPGQNGHHFADDLFKCILVNEKFCILIKISLEFLSKCPLDNKSALIMRMACHQTNDKPLPQQMVHQFTTDMICTTRGRWINP